MPLKQLTIDFQELAKETSNRFDVDFVDFNKNETKEKYLFSDFFEIASSTKKDRLSLLDNVEKDFLYAEIGNVTKQGEVEPAELSFSNRDELVEDYFKKIEKGDIQKVDENNILLAKVRPNLRKYVFIDDENKDYFYTTAFINLKPKRLNKIFYYSFRTIFYDDLMAISRQGKGYPTLKEDDLHYLKFSKEIINKLEKIEKKIISQIEPIEEKIKEMKSRIVPAQEVINEVFAKEFGFNLKKFEELKKEKYFLLNISNIKTSLVRSTVIQNSPSSNFLKEFLSMNSIFLKNILVKQIQRGKQPEYAEDGIKVIKTLNIQKGKVLFDEVQFVSKNFLEINERKAGIYKNDLLLTSTGMGRGKFALYENDEVCIADSHISIIRFNHKRIIPGFLNYYCQSFFGAEQLKYIEMHIKGTPEIYEAQLSYFQILEISLEKQQKIVSRIKTELDKQDEIRKEIEKERKKIDEIIEKAIK